MRSSFRAAQDLRWLRASRSEDQRSAPFRHGQDISSGRTWNRKVGPRTSDHGFPSHRSGSHRSGGTGGPS
jgi:hypothetical protein